VYSSVASLRKFHVGDVLPLFIFRCALGQTVDVATAVTVMRARTSSATKLTPEVYARMVRLSQTGVTIPGAGRVTWESDWLTLVAARNDMSSFFKCSPTVGKQAVAVVRTSAIIVDALQYVSVLSKVCSFFSMYVFRLTVYMFPLLTTE
jgi:hypothetical protein